ncbi:MAG: ATP-binding protein, partial [Acidobacteriota bacterium]
KSNDLFIFQIPPHILSKLSITEKDALNLAIQKGNFFYLLKVSFALQTFYEDFKSYKETLNLNGEVIAVASTPNNNPTEEVNFLTFFVSNLGKAEIEKLISLHSAQIDFENESPKKNLPENLGEVLINLVNYGKKTAQFLNKTITFETNFAEVQIPTKQIILLNEVASHLLHNAIDHAIEPLEERILIGKNPIAKIKISLEKLESEILFEIEDDGSGIDIEKIIAIAKEKGLVSDDEKFTEKEAFELIFSQGFSTNKTVSEISGRGVGLDAVKDLVEKSNGRIEVKTKDGFGSTFSVYLPQI